MAVYRIKRKVTSDGPGNYKKTEKKVKKAPGEFSEEYSQQEESTKVFSKNNDNSSDHKNSLLGTSIGAGVGGGIGLIGAGKYRKNLKSKSEKEIGKATKLLNSVINEKKENETALKHFEKMLEADKKALDKIPKEGFDRSRKELTKIIDSSENTIKNTKTTISKLKELASSRENNLASIKASAERKINSSKKLKWILPAAGIVAGAIAGKTLNERIKSKEK